MSHFEPQSRSDLAIRKGRCCALCHQARTLLRVRFRRGPVVVQVVAELVSGLPMGGSRTQCEPRLRVIATNAIGGRVTA